MAQRPQARVSLIQTVWSLRKSLLFSIFLGLVLVLISFVDSRELQWDDVVRIIMYPILGWTVTKLEQYELAHMTKVVRTWLFPLVVIPAAAGAVIAITQNPVSRIIAEVVFAVGCALILHMQPVPGDRALAQAE
jgi:hypothetical protein